jgi:two-component system sensor histidine kinase KdpD
VHVWAGDGVAHSSNPGLALQQRLLKELGGRYVEITGPDVAQALVQFTRSENATQLFLGATPQSRASELVHGSVINRIIRDGVPIDVHVIAGVNGKEAEPAPASPGAV